MKEEEIPIAGRLMAIADVYDALISNRVYKNALSHEEAMSIITNSSGSHFDPDVVDAFTHLEKEFYKISIEFKLHTKNKGFPSS